MTKNRDNPGMRRWHIILVVISLTLMPTLAAATHKKHITTATIIRATVQAVPHCLHYQTKGACVWWVKKGPVMYPQPGLKVAHYNPDLVVSVFDRGGDNPWLEVRTLYDKPMHSIARRIIKTLTGSKLGGGRHSLASAHETNVHFKEVTIIGNPAALLRLPLATIPSVATAFLPYFSSLLDVISWRFGVEMIYPATWNPFAHPIGKRTREGGQVWGHLYPRDGFIVAANDAVASAVIAQRAADIISKHHQPHAYHYLKRHCGPHCEAAKVTENNGRTQWQRIYPDESHHCAVFWGKLDEMDTVAKHTDGRYVWVLWRYYEGCVPVKGGKYLGHT